ncbi:hypothetical protein FB45DRAFT_758475 [Roridomyces roridus]|uniref:Uncharacterized protein n=1 Tax=Roridomyces roridus TaxID=1738132 RepID=A0AAD7B9X6_9AGAR|nr:hypothetical protein FB45DRAFT_758475 [Roridomyces roridus]
MLRSRPFVLLSLCFFFFFHFAAAVQHNVSLDNTDSLITYRPQSSWESGLRSGLDFGGSHSVSSDPASNAVLNFTGVAVYYLAPRWPYTVTTVITLDDGQSVLVNLTDPYATPTPPGGSESAEFSVAWSAMGLSNTTHSVVLSMSPVAANGGFIISDGFMCVFVSLSRDII